MAVDFERLVVELGREFAKRSMREELKVLRRFFVEVQERARAQRRKARLDGGRPEWDEGVVLEWMALFRLGPFKSAYEVLGAHVPCPSCGARPPVGKEKNRGLRAFEKVYEGCRRVTCRVCGESWLAESGALEAGGR